MVFEYSPVMVRNKLLRVFLPLPLLAAALAAALSLLNWFVTGRAGPFALDGDVVDFWIPIIVALVLVMAVMRPRLRLLELQGRKSFEFVCVAVAMAAIAAPAILAQLYIKDATGEMVHVKSADSIAAGSNARYFTADTLCLDRQNAAGHPEFDGSSDAVGVDIYVAAPVCREGGVRSAAWIGLKYHGSISRGGGDAALEARYQAFARTVEGAVNAEQTARYRYLERASGSDLRNYRKALTENKLDAAAAVILIPHTEAFQRSGVDNLAWPLGAFAAGTLAWLLLVLMAPLRTGEEPPPHEPSWFHVLLVPTRRNYALPLLLDTNLLVFLAMVLSGLGVMSFRIEDLVAWGADSRPLVQSGEVYRLVTSQFVHDGLIHIASNMYALLIVASYLAPVSTNRRLIAWYLVCGTGGSLASIAVHPDTVSVGASGAIFGLFGISLALAGLRDRRFGAAGNALWKNAAGVIVLNLILGATIPAIDNAGHVGGLVTGLVIGVATYFYDRRRLA
jgi:membrane associated rhomboid family serine protease